MKTLNICTLMEWFYTVMLCMKLVEEPINSHTFSPCKQHRQSHKITKYMSNYRSDDMSCKNNDSMNLAESEKYLTKRDQTGCSISNNEVSHYHC